MAFLSWMAVALSGRDGAQAPNGFEKTGLNAPAPISKRRERESLAGTLETLKFDWSRSMKALSWDAAKIRSPKRAR